MSLVSSNSSKTFLNINLQQIYAEEEEDNIVYSIREELIEIALTQIDKISQENQLIKLVTECACEALRKLISIHFYYHVECIKPDHPTWTADVPIAPSAPDTWATKNVPVQISPENDTEQAEEIIEIPTEEIRTCTCDLEVECLCQLGSQERIKEQLEILYTPETKKYRQSNVSKQTSADTELKHAGTSLEEESLPELSVKESVPCILKEGFSKIGLSTAPTKLPKIELPLPSFKQSETNVLELPPIRIAATFQAIAQEYTHDKRYKKEKKKKKKTKKT